MGNSEYKVESKEKFKIDPHSPSLHLINLKQTSRTNWMREAGLKQTYSRQTFLKSPVVLPGKLLPLPVLKGGVCVCLCVCEGCRK